MKLEEAKMEFIQNWGSIGSSWGIPKSMAQIHALLIASPDELSTEDIMETIQLSRGNVNINLRELINWRLISKKNKLGERKEYFFAEHDILKMAKKIIQERKKREMFPVLELLQRLKEEKIEGKTNEVKHFKKIILELEELITQLDQLSDLLLKLNNNTFFKKITGMVAKSI